MYRAYLNLLKPGIVVGNLISLTGGYLLASRGAIDATHGAIVALSVALVIGSGCAINNVIDRDIDKLMKRTHARPMANNQIAIESALMFAGLLAIAGFLLLFLVTRQFLSPALLLAGYIVYAGLYSLCLKRKSVHGTLVGSISGAIPPVVGYCSVSGSFDAAALVLLAIFGIWQVPHSYAIAIFRWDDYQAASIPVLPLVKGQRRAKQHIVLYIVAFIAAEMALAALGYVGKRYVALTLVMGIYWLGTAVAGFTTINDATWARKVFAVSIAAVTVLSIAMAIDIR